ncbi:MAG TPA: tripartite tricarboxylate transporter TctB family protein [Thermodesulfobacteriota bacterium]
MRARLSGRGDAVAATFIALVGLAGAAGGVSLGLYSGRAPGPGLIPLLAGAAVAVSAGAIALAAWAGPPRPAPPATPEGLRRVVIVLLLMGAWVVLLEPAGYVAATAALLVALLRFVERVPLRVTLAVALATAGGLAALFGGVLGLPLAAWPAWIS